VCIVEQYAYILTLYTFTVK